MNWLPPIALAAALFLFVAFVLRLPRAGWPAFGAALLFGLAGYALQGRPDMPSAPRDAAPQPSESSSAMIDARRELFDPSVPPSNFVVSADGFARRGRYDEAAQFLRGVVRDNPENAEAWVALGNALVEHADGNPTPAAVYAYAQAERAAPGHPAAPSFLGIAVLRAGRPEDTRAIWRQMIDAAPEGADWVGPMEERLARLDSMMAGMSAQQEPPR